MRRVGIERDVAHDAELRIGGLERLDGARNETVRVGGFTAVRRLERILDVGEERNHRNAELDAFAGDLQQLVDREAFHPGHARNGFAAGGSFHHEDRKNQIIRRDDVLAHQAAGKVVVTHASHAHHRIGTKSLHFNYLSFVPEMSLRTDEVFSPSAAGAAEAGAGSQDSSVSIS